MCICIYTHVYVYIYISIYLFIYFLFIYIRIHAWSRRVYDLRVSLPVLGRCSLVPLVASIVSGFLKGPAT